MDVHPDQIDALLDDDALVFGDDPIVPDEEQITAEVGQFIIIQFDYDVYLVQVLNIKSDESDYHVHFLKSYGIGEGTVFTFEQGRGGEGLIPFDSLQYLVEAPVEGKRKKFTLAKVDLQKYLCLRHSINPGAM